MLSSRRAKPLVLVHYSSRCLIIRKGALSLDLVVSGLAAGILTLEPLLAKLIVKRRYTLPVKQDLIQLFVAKTVLLLPSIIVATVLGLSDMRLQLDVGDVIWLFLVRI